MSIELANDWKTHSGASGAAYRVGKELALYAQRGTGLAWPSNAELHRATRLSERHIQRALRVLEARGELIRQPSQPGRRRVYLVVPLPGDAMSLFPPDVGRHNVTPKVTPTRARVGTAGNRINNTPPTPQGGSAPDLLRSIGQSGHVTVRLPEACNQRRRRRDTSARQPVERRPCPLLGRTHDHALEEEWLGLSERVRDLVGESVFEIWFGSGHLHRGGESLELGIHPDRLSWVYGRFGRVLERAVDRPLELVGCEQAGRPSGVREGERA